jgi:pyruvate dehydrogenase E1 component alpha subunit
MTKANNLTFTVPRYQYLDDQAVLTQDLPDWAKSFDNILEAYKGMLYSRYFDEKAINLQRTGLLRTYPPAIGQEAIGVGIASAMREGDILCGYYRDQALQLQRGMKPEEILRYWGGHEDGNNYQNPAFKNDLPICVPIGTQCVQAVGAAFAQQYKKTNAVTVCVIGDGGTSQGDFYEALNAAALWKLPVIFIINNNGWAISIAREKQTASESLAQKAIAAGMEGVIVDGNDIIAMKEITEKAMEKARRGDGPTLIEAETFRLCDHTTADDATRYIPPEDSAKAKTQEPFIRTKQFLMDTFDWSEDKDLALKNSIKQSVQNAAERYLAIPKEPIGESWLHLFEKLPAALQEQRSAWIAREKKLRGSHD